MRKKEKRERKKQDRGNDRPKKSKLYHLYTGRFELYGNLKECVRPTLYERNAAKRLFKKIKNLSFRSLIHRALIYRFGYK